MAELVSLAEGVAALVHDGDTVALEGFTHLIPVAAGHEIIRQGRRDLTLVRMTPDIVYDQMIGAGCAQRAGLLLGRQPGRRLAAPVPRRGRARLAGPAGDRGAQPRRHGQPVRGRRVRAAVRRAARLRRHRPGRAHRHHRADHLPVHRRGAHRGAGAATRTSRSSTPSAPTGGQRAAVGHHRRAEGGGAGGAALAGHRRGGRRPARPAARARSCCRPGRSRRSPRCPAAPTRRTPRATTTATTTHYRAWDAISRDRDAFPPGWTRPCSRGSPR